MNDKSWEEVKQSANIVYQYLNKQFDGVDVVEKIYNNALPQVITFVLADWAALEEQPDELLSHIQVVINGYRQLQKKGYIGEGNE